MPRPPNLFVDLDNFTILLESVQNQGELDAVSTRILQALAVPIALGETEIQANASIGQTMSHRIPGSSADLATRPRGGA